MQGCLIEVVREQYTDFYRDKERWRYLQKLDAKNSLLSLDLYGLRRIYFYYVEILLLLVGQEAPMWRQGFF